MEYIWLVIRSPQNFLILLLALCWETDDSKCGMISSGGQVGPLQMELMCGRRLKYRARQVECSFVDRSYRCAIEICSLIGVMSLFSWKPCLIRRRQFIKFMTKSGAALVLALSNPRPPRLMLRWEINVEYVGSGSVVVCLSRSCVKKSCMMESMPSVRCPFQLYHCSLLNSVV